MNIAILGATGNVGTRLTDEALQRGHRVTALARSAESLPARAGLTAKNIDVAQADALARALAGHDAVISSLKFHGNDPRRIIEAVKAAGQASGGETPRLLVVGGAGSLFGAPGVQIVDTPEFPAAYKAEALAGREFLNTLKGETTLDWTFLSPSALLAPGERTGKFRLGEDDLLVDAAGNSSISIEDYAIAMIDEVETPRHTRRRFTVGY
ncbi:MULTISPECIES: NAD(P)-dependent oxidoreductase [unclassified Cupriavidus]|uniref:NAD(P)-dependent oxidoreductase n=1 Tax=unclassified Cupriavidus TaxID=2640874 RepID=UPI00313B81A3